MSLILDALKKAKDLAGRKPAAPLPTALASFRFGRRSRTQRIKKIGLLAVLGLVSIGPLAYTANFWIKRMSRPKAVLIHAPRTVLPDPVPAVPAVPETPAPQQEAAKETRSTDQQKEKPANPP